jgi:hypothetical protein
MLQRYLAFALCIAMTPGCDRTEPKVSPFNPIPAETPSLAAEKRMHFEHQEFLLDLDPTWKQLVGSDPEQFQFESKALDSVLTISVILAEIPEAKMEQAAEKLLEFRKQGEREADPNGTITYGDQWVTPKAEEQLVEVAYAGYDDRGRIFRFTGFVTTRKIVSFYCETVSKDNQQAKQVFDESFRGFKFYVP